MNNGDEKRFDIKKFLVPIGAAALSFIFSTLIWGTYETVGEMKVTNEANRIESKLAIEQLQMDTVAQYESLKVVEENLAGLVIDVRVLQEIQKSAITPKISRTGRLETTVDLSKILDSIYHKKILVDGVKKDKEVMRIEPREQSNQPLKDFISKKRATIKREKAKHLLK